MKKQGKYEKRTEAVAAKQPTAKSALLQTYFTSLVSLVLCCAMFLGTSYAWFTSEVNNEANEIYVGTLSVGFFKQDKDTTATNKWLDLAGENKLFDSNIRWEPGYTSLETVKITNRGDLAFKYTLGFTDGAITNIAGTALTEEQQATIASQFDVWVYDHEANENAAPTVNAYSDITAEGTKWIYAGALDEILAGDSVLVGTMPEIPANKVMETVAETTATEPGEAAGDTYTIALHMKESATADVMGHKIKLNAKLIAYQMVSEKDAFGDVGYDANIQLISTLEDLQKAVDEADGGEVFMLAADMEGDPANDVEGDLTVTQKPGVKFTIDGNGHKFSGVITVDGKSQRYETAGLTIQNVNFSGVTCPDSEVYPDAYIRLGHIDAARYTNNVTVKNCTFSSTDNSMVAVKSYTGGDWNLVIDSCTVDSGMHSMLQVANVEKGLKIVDCTVNSKNGINLNNTLSLEMSGCTFNVTGYAVRFGDTSVGNTDPKTYRIEDCALKSLCAAEDDYVIIFRKSAKNATLTLVDTTVEGTRTIQFNKDFVTVIGLN